MCGVCETVLLLYLVFRRLQCEHCYLIERWILQDKSYKTRFCYTSKQSMALIG